MDYLLWTYLRVAKRSPAFIGWGFIEGSGTEAVSYRRTPVKQPERGWLTWFSAS